MAESHIRQGIRKRIEGRELADSVVDLVDLSDPEVLNGFIDYFERKLREQKPIEPPKPEPIARLGKRELRFGKYKTFDAADEPYLNWLCGVSEELTKDLQTYLKHPDFTEHRRRLP